MCVKIVILRPLRVYFVDEISSYKHWFCSVEKLPALNSAPVLCFCLNVTVITDIMYSSNSLLCIPSGWNNWLAFGWWQQSSGDRKNDVCQMDPERTLTLMRIFVGFFLLSLSLSLFCIYIYIFFFFCLWHFTIFTFDLIAFDAVGPVYNAESGELFHVHNVWP